MNKITYDQPAKSWRQALPLGNGRTGLMIYGSLRREKICFNDGTLWSGYPKDYNRVESREQLDRVRQLIFDGENARADALCEKQLSGFYSETFLPLGQVTLSFCGLPRDGYSRCLDLSRAVHTAKSSGAKSVCFSSYPDNISVYRVTAQRPFSVTIRTGSKLHHRVEVEGQNLFLLGHAPDYAAPNYLRTELHPIRYGEKKGMAFCLQTRVQTNGTVHAGKAALQVKNATELVLYFATATGFNGFDQMPLTDQQAVRQRCQAVMGAAAPDYRALLERHLADYTALFDRQSVSFHCDRAVHADTLLRQAKSGGDESALAELMYNYGKYMLIAGSRKGGQPLNLQGIWNNSLRPPWSSNYTVNINTEMNYWGASRAGLSDCIEPLIRMVYETMENGQDTAKINYGCRGFACNHNVDLWRKTPPVQGTANYMFAPLCGVWLSNELYTHYQNGQLGAYRAQIEEIVTQAAWFVQDFLVLHRGQYVICPSASPENVFKKDGKTCKLDYASAFDMALARQAFQNALEISDDTCLKEQIRQKLPLLYPYREGKNGICEWHTDYPTPEKRHRHFSPLYGFYPGNTIGYLRDQDQTRWVRALYHYRTENATQYIGWSAAWAICLSARLREPERVSKVIRSMLAHSVFHNLFCVHPPFYFQIDGNLGFVAGIHEMLLTEEQGVIELLPALPANYAHGGEVHNMVVAGAQVSFAWRDGVVTEARSDRPIVISRRHLSPAAQLQNITVTEER